MPTVRVRFRADDRGEFEVILLTDNLSPGCAEISSEENDRLREPASRSTGAVASEKTWDE